MDMISTEAGAVEKLRSTRVIFFFVARVKFLIFFSGVHEEASQKPKRYRVPPPPSENVPYAFGFFKSHSRVLSNSRLVARADICYPSRPCPRLHVLPSRQRPLPSRCSGSGGGTSISTPTASCRGSTSRVRRSIESSPSGIPCWKACGSGRSNLTGCRWQLREPARLPAQEGDPRAGQGVPAARAPLVRPSPPHAQPSAGARDCQHAHLPRGLHDRLPPHPRVREHGAAGERAARGGGVDARVVPDHRRRGAHLAAANLLLCAPGAHAGLPGAALRVLQALRGSSFASACRI